MSSIARLADAYPARAEQNFRIAPACASEIIGLFRSQAAMHLALNTNAVTWAKVTAGPGGRESTVRAIVLDYFQLLHELKEKNFITTRKDVFGVVAKQTYARKASDIDAANWQSYIVLPEGVSA